MGSLLALASAGGASAKSGPTTVVAGPITQPKAKQLDFDAFYARHVTIHVGDSVRWEIHGFHTVTFPGARPAPGLFIPLPGDRVSGVKDAAGAPFWFNGQTTIAANPAGASPSGPKSTDGTKFVNSGLPSPNGAPRPFIVRFTKAGTFSYTCLVHPGMKGTVKVLSAGHVVPSAAAAAKAAVKQYAHDTASALRLAKVNPGPLRVFAGNDAGGVAWLRFFPSTLTVHTGDSVTFQIKSTPEIHTITFGPESYTKPIENGFVTPRPNPKGPPTLLLNPLAAFPSDPPGPAGLPAYDGLNHGNGFESSGIIDTDPHTPQPSSVSIKFSKPGTYRFECVVHAGMDGTIVVK